MVRFLRDEAGQGLVEYSLIIALIATALVLALLTFKNRILKFMNHSSEQVGHALD